MKAIGELVVITLCVGVVVALFCSLLVTIHDGGYQAGQIDAATGHQHYHLTTQPDQTSRWERRD